MSGRTESADMEGFPQDDPEPAAPQEDREDAIAPREWSRAALALGVGVRTAMVLCLATALVHVIMVFLHVAPSNVVSKRYGQQINAWIFPLFEQNWRLFAPNPDSVNRQISARTAHAAPDGSFQVSDWIDLTAVDDAAVEHNIFPSHVHQNMLRRAWTSYLESHGEGDEPHSEHALLMEEYLRNIAADRVADHNGGAFEHIQLRVTTLPIAAPGATGGNRPSRTSPPPTEIRRLPWWKVPPHGD